VTILEEPQVSDHESRLSTGRQHGEHLRDERDLGKGLEEPVDSREG
jgi:hypothetical protein